MGDVGGPSQKLDQAQLSQAYIEFEVDLSDSIVGYDEPPPTCLQRAVAGHLQVLRLEEATLAIAREMVKTTGRDATDASFRSLLMVSGVDLIRKFAPWNEEEVANLAWQTELDDPLNVGSDLTEPYRLWLVSTDQRGLRKAEFTSLAAFWVHCALDPEIEV